MTSLGNRESQVIPLLIDTVWICSLFVPADRESYWMQSCRMKLCQPLGETESKHAGCTKCFNGWFHIDRTFSRIQSRTWPYHTYHPGTTAAACSGTAAVQQRIATQHCSLGPGRPIPYGAARSPSGTRLFSFTPGRRFRLPILSCQGLECLRDRRKGLPALTVHGD